MYIFSAEESEDADVLGEYEAQPQKPIEYYRELVQSATVENIDFNSVVAS